MAFFDEQHDDHDSFAVTTFVHWIKHSTKFRHIPSGTWRGGPLGVRWVLAVLAYIVGSLTFLDFGIEVPEEIQLLRSEDFQKRAWNQIKNLADWLARALQISIDILTQTFPQRSAAWKEAILTAHQRFSTAGSYSHSARSTPSAENTNGMPTDPAEIHAYAQGLIQNGATIPEVPAPPPECETGPDRRSMREKPPAKVPTTDDFSGEEFDLDNVGESSEDDSGSAKGWKSTAEESESGKLSVVLMLLITYYGRLESDSAGIPSTRMTDVFNSFRNRGRPSGLGVDTAAPRPAANSEISSVGNGDSDEQDQETGHGASRHEPSAQYTESEHAMHQDPESRNTPTSQYLSTPKSSEPHIASLSISSGQFGFLAQCTCAFWLHS